MIAAARTVKSRHFAQLRQFEGALWPFSPRRYAFHLWNH